MECQHHLIQQSEHERPLVPALTVVGFAQYYMSCILAHPDTEFHRLERIVADVPSIIVAGGLNGAKEGVSPSEILPKAIRRDQLPSKADAKSKRLLDGAFKDLMYDLELQPPPPKHNSPPRPPRANDTIAITQVQVPTPTPELNQNATEKPDYFSSRSTSRRKYAQPSPLHTIGDDDDDDISKAHAKTDGSLERDESEWHRRERELERASMPGPRPGYARLHSWHTESTDTDGSAAHQHSQSSSSQQRYGGRASSQSYSNAPRAPASDSAAVVPQRSSAITTGSPRGSVASNASSSGYWGHGGRTPPPTRHNSTSVPDVSSTGPFNFSSSSSSSPMGMATPTSGGPGSPVATSMTTHQRNTLQYRPAAATVPTAKVAESARSSSITGGVERLEQQKSHHVRWEGVPQQQQHQRGAASPTTTSPRTGSISGQNIKTERRPSQRHHHHGHHHHRRYPSGGGGSAVGDVDNDKDNRKGETWEEFLRAQKKGEGYHQR
ncbi:hypothetical protein PG993_007640 [Apiospora rasikravindrae]|uniref:DUF7514 domain-containing protein n=1 Tax=Apiospora rasikravindrae TaxID=990691 RepID=A0ABR1SZX2_9PEZI